MITTFGSVDSTAPEGFLPRRVHFTTMTRLNEGTKEGMLTRIISGEGFSTRELPQPLGFMPYTLHSDASVAHVVGRIDQLTIDGNNVEAWGWLLDDEMGREAFKHTALKTMRGNSMDMADVRLKVDVDYNDEGDMAIVANFVEAAFAGTTLVAQPAFGSAAAVMEEELVAALTMEGDLECDLVGEPKLPDAQTSLTAATVTRYPHTAFTMVEPDELTPWQVTPDGSHVFGHLGSWQGCHTGILDRCVTIPRSHTNYARYCYSKQYTDQGHVFTGPLLLLNGHKATRAAINEAMESMENVWANISVIDGKFGPWACGVVLPDVTDEQLARAMSGRVSGHWLDGELYAVVSVPAAGFTTERQTQFQVEFDESGEVEYLAASFGIDCGCDEEPTVEERLAAVEMALGITSIATLEVVNPGFDPELLSLAVLAELATGDDDDDS